MSTIRYSGDESLNKDTTLNLHPYFTHRPPKEWSLVDFIDANPHQPEEYVRGLHAIGNHKGQPADLKNFAKNTWLYFKSEYGKLEIMKEQATRLSSTTADTIKEQSFAQELTNLVQHPQQQQQQQHRKRTFTSCTAARDRTPSPHNHAQAQDIDNLFTNESFDFSALEWLPCRWTSGNQDLVQLFREFQSSQTTKPYSLSADGIADLTDGGEFTLYLNALFEPREIDPWESCLELDIDKDLEGQVTDILRPFQTHKDMIKAVRGMNHEDDVVHYLGQVLAGYERFFRLQRSAAMSNERQVFTDLIVAALDGPLSKNDLTLRLFEVPVKGNSWRKNVGRDPLSDKTVPGRMADAVVESPTGLQLLIVETAHLDGRATTKKAASDRWKIARALRDTWLLNVREAISDEKKPSNVVVFGLQLFGVEAHLLALDFVGTHRLYHVGKVKIPVSESALPVLLPRLLSLMSAAADQVKLKCTEYAEAQELSRKEQRLFAQVLQRFNATSSTPPNPNKKKKKKDVVALSDDE
ncbi:hypothetical protein BGZ91_004444 [Linnemannia elongata]|nr:hypothetical protein BGZ91_004444 [Linnemannia elongata]KAG0073584.1 hypothetical protein BGZ90_011467 [Linnemannia elongata]